ncbi:MAG: tetratricopeptide repeat protein [Spirochaetes bacterium]|nr:tetratricopeptide repeat protein [Spirochaetota bacterium]MBU1079461.1 tetratricopeptide repeat protein [Spirochaetota bacterium]
MKKTLSLAAVALALIVCVGAQEAAPGTMNPAPQGAPQVSAVVAAVPAATFASASSRRYVVWSDSGKDDAVALSLTLDGLFGVYNEYFRFDEGALKAQLTVRKFSGKDGFDAYLKKVIGETKDDFVYLHYPTVERSELVVFNKESSADFDASLAHQAFVQFLKAFVPEPPLWIREGFAVFFERTRFDPKAGAVAYAENQAWLETVKLLQSQSRLYGVSELMLLSSDEARTGLDVFYPQSWALVSFFINSPDRRYNRFIWDAIGHLSPEASLEQNQVAVREFFLKWHGQEAAESDFLSYLDGQKTFAELVTSGVRSYGDKDAETAYKSFAQALAKNPASYIPHYYLGLIAYARGDYALADEYYKKALELGSDAPITNYALGINAYASRRFDEAKAYLEKAKDGDPTKYESKAGEIIARIASDSGL